MIIAPLALTTMLTVFIITVREIAYDKFGKIALTALIASILTNLLIVTQSIMK